MPTPEWNEDDRVLFRRLASGDTETVGVLFDRHGARLFAHALWLTKRKEDAEDAVQSVFAAVLQQGAGLLGIRRPREYLHRAVRYAVLDRIRAQKPSEEPDDALLARAPTAEDLAEVQKIRAVLGRIDPAQREAVLLHLWEGFTFREIGRICSVPTSTAASRYRLGIQKLRRALGEEAGP